MPHRIAATLAVTLALLTAISCVTADSANAPATQPDGQAGSGAEHPRAEPADRLQKVIAAEFEEVPLEDVLEHLAAATGENLIVRWQRLRLVGVKEDLPITLNLDHVTAEQVLDLVLVQASAAAGHLDPIGWQRDRGVVTVGTLRDLRRQTTLAVYDASCILRPTTPAATGGEANLTPPLLTVFGEALMAIPLRVDPDTGAVTSSVPAGEYEVALASTDEEPWTYSKRLQSLTDIIFESVGTPDEWLDQESTLSAYEGLLVVRTNASNHDTISALLSAMCPEHGDHSPVMIP